MSLGEDLQAPDESAASQRLHFNLRKEAHVVPCSFDLQNWKLANEYCSKTKFAVICYKVKENEYITIILIIFPFDSFLFLFMIFSLFLIFTSSNDICPIVIVFDTLSLGVC